MKLWNSFTTGPVSLTVCQTDSSGRARPVWHRLPLWDFADALEETRAAWNAGVSGPVATDGEHVWAAVSVGSTSRSLWLGSYAAATGELEWAADADYTVTPWHNFTAPGRMLLSSEGYLITVHNNASWRAYDATDGSVVWESAEWPPASPTANQIPFDAVIADGKLVIVSGLITVVGNQQAITVVDTSDGSITYTKTVSDAGLLPPICTDGTDVFGRGVADPAIDYEGGSIGTGISVAVVDVAGEAVTGKSVALVSDSGLQGGVPLGATGSRIWISNPSGTYTFSNSGTFVQCAGTLSLLGRGVLDEHNTLWCPAVLGSPTSTRLSLFGFTSTGYVDRYVWGTSIPWNEQLDIQAMYGLAGTDVPTPAEELAAREVQWEVHRADERYSGRLLHVAASGSVLALSGAAKQVRGPMQWFMGREPLYLCGEAPPPPDDYDATGSGPQFTDTFTDLNNTALENHTSDSGHQWTASAFPTEADAYCFTFSRLLAYSDGYLLLFARCVTTDTAGELLNVDMLGVGRAGILFRSSGTINSGGAVTEHWAALVEINGESETGYIAALYNRLPHPIDGGEERIFPTPVATAEIAALPTGELIRLTVHDDGATIGVDVNGVRAITYASTSGNTRKRIGLYSEGTSFELFTARGRAGCTGASDEWTWNGSAWTGPTGECPPPCESLPPIADGTFVNQTLPGRCGRWD